MGDERKVLELKTLEREPWDDESGCTEDEFRDLVEYGLEEGDRLFLFVLKDRGELGVQRIESSAVHLTRKRNKIHPLAAQGFFVNWLNAWRER